MFSRVDVCIKTKASAVFELEGAVYLVLYIYYFVRPGLTQWFLASWGNHGMRDCPGQNVKTYSGQKAKPCFLSHSSFRVCVCLQLKNPYFDDV